MGRLRRMSDVCCRSGAENADSVARSRARNRGNDRGRAMEVLMEAQGYYMNMERFRRERERNKRYNYGDQWSDVICVDGREMTEAQYIM